MINRRTYKRKHDPAGGASPRGSRGSSRSPRRCPCPCRPRWPRRGRPAEGGWFGFWGVDFWCAFVCPYRGSTTSTSPKPQTTKNISEGGMIRLETLIVLKLFSSSFSSLSSYWKSDKQFSTEQFEPTVSQSTVPSHMYMYIYIYIYIDIHIHTYIYIYIRLVLLIRGDHGRLELRALGEAHLSTIQEAQTQRSETNNYRAQRVSHMLFIFWMKWSLGLGLFHSAQHPECRGPARGEGQADACIGAAKGVPRNGVWTSVDMRVWIM